MVLSLTKRVTLHNAPILPRLSISRRPTLANTTQIKQFIISADKGYWKSLNSAVVAHMDYWTEMDW